MAENNLSLRISKEEYASLGIANSSFANNKLCICSKISYSVDTFFNEFFCVCSVHVNENVLWKMLQGLQCTIINIVMGFSRNRSLR